MEKVELIKKVLGENAKIEHPLLGGMMNQSFVASNNNQKYVLYISTEQANEMVNRVLEKESHSIIYNLGITSKNIYFDTDKGIKINEFIEGSSLDKIDNFDPKLVAELFIKLHSSKVVAKEDYGPFNRFINYENEANEFVKVRENDYLLLKETLFSNKTYLESQEKVLCHNDSQRSNIVKDLNNNYYLIDFEFVANNDPIYDIAAFGNGKVSEGLEVLKETYPSLDDDKLSRYYLWRIFLSLQWYNVALVKHYRGEGKTHNIDFLDVASHFLGNAKDALKGLEEIKK